jgi:renalase
VKERCLIIGAGMAGLSAAGVLQKQGWEVILVDKGRKPGGRMATRRFAGTAVDYGAQFFTVRDADFANEVARWEKAGLVRPWFETGGHARYRGVEGMNSIPAHLASHFDVRAGVRVEKLQAVNDGWLVTTDTSGTLEAAAVILTPPVPQSLALSAPFEAELDPGVAGILRWIAYDPCLSLVVALDGPSAIADPGYAYLQGDLSWAADNSSKLHRNEPSRVTLHASPEFSREHFESPPEEVAQLMIAAASDLLGAGVTEWHFHRWRYSAPVSVDPKRCLASRTPAPLVYAGDAFGGPRVEGAWLSGQAAARALMEVTVVHG